MSGNYFDRLEAELRAAVPRATGGHVGLRHKRPRWRRGLGGLTIAIAVAVPVAVVLLAVALLGHRHTPARPPVLHHRVPRPAPGEIEYPLGAAPTLSQLLENFAVLRRPQTPQDRSWNPHCDCAGSARQLNRLTRLARTLPDGYGIYLDVEQFITGGQLNMAAGSYVLNFEVVDPHGSSTGSSFGPNVNFSVSPLPSGGPRRDSNGPQTASNNAVWTSIVPDGVATVQWTFGCPGRPRTASRCAAIGSRTFTVPVVNNVAARQILVGGICRSCGPPPQVTWRSVDGRVVASFTGFGNLAAPPFVKGGQGYRVLRVLQPTGLGGAGIGQSASAATQTIERLLGPPADANVPAGGCRIDHESVWTSPATAEPLTIFLSRGRFVGYQYGAPVSEIGLRLGPGAVLATPRGLTLAETVAVAKRRYGPNFATTAARGGTWSATADGGTLRGFVLPIIYPLRVVTAKNPVATIDAGITGCPTSGK